METKMYEIIWSWHKDDYIIRQIVKYSNIIPQFVGTLLECEAHFKTLQGD